VPVSFFYRELIAIGSFVHSVELNIIQESSILVTVCSWAKWHCSSCCPNLLVDIRYPQCTFPTDSSVKRSLKGVTHKDMDRCSEVLVGNNQI